MPVQSLPQVLHQLAIGKASVCQQNYAHPVWHHPCRLPQHPLNRPQPHCTARLSHNSPGNRNGSTSIHNPNPNNAQTVPHHRRIQAQIDAVFAPLAEGLSNQPLMYSCHVNPSVGEPSSKPSLVRLSIGCPTHHMHSKSVEMDILALKDADAHPAQRLKMPHVTPEVLALTQIIMQRMIKTGSRCHWFCRFVW